MKLGVRILALSSTLLFGLVGACVLPSYTAADKATGEGEVTCGAETCITPQVCCIANVGGIVKLTCTSAEQCTQGALPCDGREDCGGEACCAHMNNGTPTDSYCGPCQDGDRRLCHPPTDDYDCDGRECATRSFFGGSYGLCK